jgi:hypothetical protein
MNVHAGDFQREAPNNIEAEQSVLGSIPVNTVARYPARRAAALTAPRFLFQLDAMFVFAPANSKRRRPCTLRSGKLIARRQGPAR